MARGAVCLTRNQDRIYREYTTGRSIYLTDVQNEVYSAMRKPGAEAHYKADGKPKAYWIVDGLKGRKTRQVWELVFMGLLTVYDDDVEHRRYAKITEGIVEMSDDNWNE